MKILPEKDLLNPLAELTSTAVKRICYSRVKSEESRGLKAILSESLKECRRPKVCGVCASKDSLKQISGLDECNESY